MTSRGQGLLLADTAKGSKGYDAWLVEFVNIGYLRDFLGLGFVVSNAVSVAGEGVVLGVAS